MCRIVDSTLFGDRVYHESPSFARPNLYLSLAVELAQSPNIVWFGA
jgi:hypothetical protein